MGFSSRLKAHKHLLTLETLKFIVEYLQDENVKQAALRSGIPETYAARHGQWLKKHTFVKQALEKDYDEKELRLLQKEIMTIESSMDRCKEILGLEDTE
jgi:phage terminase small subunit